MIPGTQRCDYKIGPEYGRQLSKYPVNTQNPAITEESFVLCYAFFPMHFPATRFRPVKFSLCLVFLLGLSFVCYSRPLPDDFDRYIYEAIVRGRTQAIAEVYSFVKHESPRAEASAILDSPQHLRELEPLYAIRPLYIEMIYWLSAVLPIQKAINLISAASLFGIGVVVLLWTKHPVLSALLMAAYPVLSLGRLGTPDALAGLLAICALWLVQQSNRVFLALCILFLSLGVRTDNLVLLLVVLGWLVLEKRIALYSGLVLAAVALALVLGINYWAGSYGWVVLFRYSFISGRYPAQEPHTLTFREYFAALFSGASVILTRISVWFLFGLLASWRKPSRLLLVTAVAAAFHFLMFPSPEDRYFVWAYIIAAISFICSYASTKVPQPPAWSRTAASTL